MLKQILECYPDEKILKADGLDEAVIGIDDKDMRLIYSVKKCIKILTDQMQVTEADLEDYEIAEGITVEDKKHEMAVEHFEFNVKDAYVGKLTPIWCEDDFEDDFEDDLKD